MCCQAWEPNLNLTKSCLIPSSFPLSLPVPFTVPAEIYIRILSVSPVCSWNISSSLNRNLLRVHLPPFTFHIPQSQEVIGFLLALQCPLQITSPSCKISFETHLCRYTNFLPYHGYLLSINPPPPIHWSWFTSKILSIPILIFFLSSPSNPWSQILDLLSSNHLPLLYFIFSLSP